MSKRESYLIRLSDQVVPLIWQSPPAEITDSERVFICVWQLEAEVNPVVDLPVAGQPAPPANKPGAPKVPGISTAKKWKLEVNNLYQLCLFFLETWPDQGYVVLDMKKVEKRLKQLDGRADWPGCEVVVKRNMRVTVKE